MRIAAGVLILVVVVFNFIGGFAYMALGSLGEAGSGGIRQAAREAAADPRNAVNAAQAEQAAAVIEGKASMFKVFGIVFIALGALGIGAGVVLFMKKALGFAMGVGVGQIIADALFLVLVIPTLGSFIGIIAGIFVVIAVVMTKKALANPAIAPAGIPGRPM